MLQIYMNTCFNIIGLMSGTSMDGVDVALLKTDGHKEIDFGPSHTYAYPPNIRLEGLKISRHLAETKPHCRSKIENEYRDFSLDITRKHIEAVLSFLKNYSIKSEDIDYVVFHGQTVYHNPAIGLTLQLGIADLLAKQIGIDVIYDMRLNDIAHHGQGAPLVPVFHYALAQKYLSPRYNKGHFINIGGVSNMSAISNINGDIEKCLFAADCGPGNAFIDDYVKQKFHCQYDKDGTLAFQGCVHDDLIKEFLKLPYFSCPPPKSLDRYSFSVDNFLKLKPLDCVASLSALTADCIITSIAYFGFKPDFIVVSGGGVYNRFIFERIKHAYVYTNVIGIDAIGLDNDALEAHAFAYLGARHVTNAPLTFPLTTGVKAPVSGGKSTALFPKKNTTKFSPSLAP